MPFLLSRTARTADRARPVFNPEDVDQRLRRLKVQGNEREQGALDQTYERMLDRGLKRFFAANPSGIPDKDAAVRSAA